MVHENENNLQLSMTPSAPPYALIHKKSETKEEEKKQQFQIRMPGAGSATVYLTGLVVSFCSGGVIGHLSTAADSAFLSLTEFNSVVSDPSVSFLLVSAVVLVNALAVAPFRQPPLWLRSSSFFQEEELVKDEETGEESECSDAVVCRYADCMSQEVELECVELPQERVETKDTAVVTLTSLATGYKDKMVARYIKRRCVYPSGSPAEVSHGDSPDEIPQNYIKFCQNDEQKAHDMWEATKEWRIKRDVWKIHTGPNPWYSAIKECYPHYCHGYSKCGCTVVYESAGRLNLKELFQGECQIDNVLHHYLYFMEWLSNKLSASEELRRVRCPDDVPSHNSSTWGMMSVIDVQGATLSSVWSMDVLNYLRRVCAINSDHYPLTMKRVFIVNSPFWVAGVFQTLQPIIPDTVQVEILSGDYMEVLHEYISDDQIPKEFGGSSSYPLGQHPFEVEFDDLVRSADADPNDSMEETQATVLSTESSGELDDLKDFDNLDDGKEFHISQSMLDTEEAVFLVEDAEIYETVPMEHRVSFAKDDMSAKHPSEQQSWNKKENVDFTGVEVGGCWSSCCDVFGFSTMQDD